MNVANVGPMGAGGETLGDALGEGLSEGVSLGEGEGLSLGLADGLELGVSAGPLSGPRENSSVSSTTTATRSRPPRTDRTMTSVRDLPPPEDGGPPAGGRGDSGGWLNRTVGASAERWSNDSVGNSWLMACLSLLWGAAGRQLSASICPEPISCLELSTPHVDTEDHGAYSVETARAQER